MRLPPRDLHHNKVLDAYLPKTHQSHSGKTNACCGK